MPHIQICALVSMAYGAATAAMQAVTHIMICHCNVVCESSSEMLPQQPVRIVYTPSQVPVKPMNTSSTFAAMLVLQATSDVALLFVVLIIGNAIIIQHILSCCLQPVPCRILRVPESH